MNRKVGVIVGMVAVVLLVMLQLDRNSRPLEVAPQPTASATTNSGSGQTVIASLRTTGVPSIEPAAGPNNGNPPASAAGMVPAAEPDNSASIPPTMVLRNVRRAVHQFGEMFNGNPVGTNPEITAALSGKNPKQINFIDNNAGMRVNDQGEMIDPWGTPYFFHQISGSEMEIHSAGPDRIMWTADDLVAQ
jgi:hypothetical protein